MRLAARVVIASCALLAGAGEARAHIPAPEAVARAAAEASRAQGRNRAFRFSVAVRTSTDPAPSAFGELLVDPGGSARIELRHASGFLERQIRRASALAASRDGERVPNPHPLAPPLWVALAGTGGELLARASELGASPSAIALGYDGARDCYVIGGVGGGPSVWIDKDTRQVARVDLADGSKVRFLAWATRGGAVLPGTIEIETAALTFTLELTGSAVTELRADDFADAWLSAGTPSTR